MAKRPDQARPAPRLSVASSFRQQIESAVSEGVAREEMTLHLTLGDAHRIKGDHDLAVEDVNFSGGVMRFLGVKVEQGGVAASSLELPA
jgi:hypothetical protein